MLSGISEMSSTVLSGISETSSTVLSGIRISSLVSQTLSSLNIGVLPTPTPSYSSKATPSSLLSKPTGTGSSDAGKY